MPTQEPCESGEVASTQDFVPISIIFSYRQAFRALQTTSYVQNNYKVASAHIPLRHMYVVVYVRVRGQTQPVAMLLEKRESLFHPLNKDGHVFLILVFCLDVADYL